MDTFGRTLIISYLAVLPLSFYLNLSFRAAVCTLECGSIVGSLRSSFASHPSLGMGWGAPPLNQVASKSKTMLDAFLIVENN